MIANDHELQVTLERIARFQTQVAHLRQVPEGTKGSLRSETVDVGEIARLFGGGGHKLAAGYTRRGMRPHEAKEELLDVLAERLDLGGTR